MKNKLNLKDLKVKSFVTELDTNTENTVKGAAAGTKTYWTCIKCSLFYETCGTLPLPKEPVPFN